MSAHRLLADLYLDGTPHAVTDPGPSGKLNVDRQFAVINLVSTSGDATFTRELPDPKFVNQRLLLTMKTDGGDITVTADSAINDDGDTIIVFDSVGKYIDLVAVEDAAGTFAWRGEGTAWVGSSAFWAGAPSASPANPDPLKRDIEVFDDFVLPNISAALGGWTLLGTNGTAVLGDAEDAGLFGRGGFLYMDSSSSADNDYATVKAGFSGTGAPFMIVENSGKKLWYETRVIFEGSASTQNMYCIGLLDSGADDILTDDSGAQAVEDGFYFRVLSETPTKIDTCVNQSGTETEIKNEAATLVQGTAMTLGMKFDGVTTLTFYIDRVALTDIVTIGDTGNVPNDVGLTPVFGLKDGAVGTANTILYVDYIRCVQLR